MEWKLFEGPPPNFTQPSFFRDHHWVPSTHQPGHSERTRMVRNMVDDVISKYDDVKTLSDIGCGDGSLLWNLRHWAHVKMWGYDAGKDNITVAQNHRLDVRWHDILQPGMEYGDLITCCEVVEHLADPHAFIAGLPGNQIILSSPSAETDEWHYEHHAWAWDMRGYAKMVTDAGWRIVHHRECQGSIGHHNNVMAHQRFQAIYAVKDRDRIWQ